MERAMTGWIILIGLTVAGEWFVHWFHLPIPGGLVGMLLLLTIALTNKRIIPHATTASQALLQNMMLLFIPLVAGILDQATHIQGHWVAFLASCIAGAALTFITTARVFQVMLNKQQARQTQ
jgi:holin-like protein